MRTYWFVLSRMFQYVPVHTLLTIGLNVITGLILPLQVYCFQGLVSSVNEFGSNQRVFLLWLVFLLGLTLVQVACRYAAEYIRLWIRIRLSHSLERDVLLRYNKIVMVSVSV